jgi:membrane-bound metal-dependent hydrolase YbcI (DUF457 family)
MLGKDHVLFAVTLAVTLDGATHVTGPALEAVFPSVPPDLLASKCFFLAAVALGSLLPDIDSPSSTVGRPLGIVGKAIAHFAKHRHFFHSLLGLVPWTVLSLGLYFLAQILLARHGLAIPSEAVMLCQRCFLGLLFGCCTHLIADSLTIEGVPLLWPWLKHFGFPPNPHWRIRTGHFSEHAVDDGVLLLVGYGIWRAIIRI